MAPGASILVTGGAGAIGCNLANALFGAGHDVVVLDNLVSGRRELLDPGITFIQGSVCDNAALEEAFSRNPRLVFHLAAFFANQNSVDHPHDDLATNGHGILNVLEFSVRHRVLKMVYTSSSCVYENLETMSEDAPLADFDTPYAATKFLGEKYCRFFSAHHGLDTAICRMFNSYGPGEFPGRYRNVIPNWISAAMAQKPLPVTGTGDEMRDFNFIADTLQGLTRAMFTATEPGDIFNIASGRGTRIIDLARTINRVAGNPAGVEMKEKRSWDNVTRRLGVIEKAQKVLGYMPSTSLEEGIEKTHQWFVDVVDEKN